MTEPESASPSSSAVSAHAFPCRECGAELRFQPGTSALVCPYCGASNAIESGDEPAVELDYRAHLAKLAEAEPTLARRVLKCGSCAAEVERAEHVTSLDCAFCGAPMVAAEEERVVIKPAWLLPFHVDTAAARDAYRVWIAKRWFAPSDLKRYARQDERLQGIYLPHWTYDARTTTRYTGMRGDHYWVTVGSGKNKRRVRRTRWFPASGTVADAFDDILVVASRTLPRDDMDALTPWDLANLVAYSQDYLAGFAAESYQVGLEEGFGEAAKIMDGHIRNTIRHDIGGDVQQIHTVDITWHEMMFKHILLPVWVTAYRYRDTVYRVLVNARTGEVRGQRPWSFWKIFFAVLGAAAVAGGIALVAVISSS